ncbi:aldehyde dehydrogenase family protein [Roseisalinus antarcticus]|uniref:Aldehyde dehydrogenase, thermostable n=1 Tax=Roseisalinus antarcticus TaxID=254357 RepID=A0A1Y5TKE0_9RHOB|nr:aldehyde dehydrogenase family protein [Roseisalinus antarcticus]SLN64032.1 Aldehyde dehydrogenase, thermostable [Roseisalinus antarcticus]
MKPLLIDGDWLTTGTAAENVSPSDISDRIDSHAQAGRAEAEAAVRAARGALDDWAHSTPARRHAVLKHVGDELMARREELGELLAREEGKTRAEGIAETRRAAQIFDFFAGEAMRLSGEILPSVRPGVGIEMTREPVGVVGVITPWNFPLAIPAWKIAPALAWGNTVVFKPAELVPGSAWALAEILSRSGLPAGAFNLVTGPGGAVGGAMLASPDLDAITFTGSEATGTLVEQASLRHGHKVQLEMGGQNPLIVLDDADLDLAVACAVDGAFHQTGQRCSATSRIIVTEAIHGRFVEDLTTRVRALRVGHALDPDTQIGPLASAERIEEVTAQIARARREGGNLRCGGEPVACRTQGHFLAPALFTDTTPEMTINREEVFGPVASVIRVRDYEEALAVANDTRFGLTAGIVTTSLRHATHFKRHAQAGVVMVNLPTAGLDPHVAFGGRKGSSRGPMEQGRQAAEFFTILKTAYTAAG